MTSEQRFMALVDRYTRSLPDYDRGVTATFALAAYRTGYRQATTEMGANSRPMVESESQR